jgi:UDP-sugar pyrophosphorylase
MRFPPANLSCSYKICVEHVCQAPLTVSSQLKCSASLVATQSTFVQVSLPSETATGTCFLGLYLQSILALQHKSGATTPLPLAIMTSDETHTATIDLLKKNKYFGASARQVSLIKQGKVPCLADHAGHLATDDANPYKLLLKPHGHGDVHSLLHTSGLAKSWLQQGFKWVAFLQDTNALVFRGLIPSLGVCCGFMHTT